MRNLEEYIDVVGDSVVAQLHRKARRLYNRHIINVNSTFIGGGVAEILSSLVPLMNDSGVDAGWRVLHGNAAFYDLTKKFHNGLQGGDIPLTEEDKRLYSSVNKEYASYTHFDHDCIIIHDPQPLAMIKYLKKRQPWVWRCHIDLSDPNPVVWNYLKTYMLRYDMIIVSAEAYRKEGLPVEQRVIAPAIDPLSLKNMDLTENQIQRYITEAGIPTDKPIITQVSRMDKWKDPEGVLEVYERVRKKVDCRLVYCYNLASDDPEGMAIYTTLQEQAKDLIESGLVVFVMGNNEYLVNAVQRYSDVIIQKSIKEGFCLCVTEALWKAKPVVASRVGGIPLQIEDGEGGYIVDPYDYDGFAERITEILTHKSLARNLGNAAKENVRRNFVITRLMGNYLDLIAEQLG